MSRSDLTTRNLERTRRDLLDAATRLMERGEEPTMRAVAAAAGVGERTIYRYFASREVLDEALGEHITPMIGAPLCDRVDDLERYVRELYASFEAHRALTVALLRAPWFQPHLARSRAANLAALTWLIREAYPCADASDVDAAAAVLRTIASGAGWAYQRESCGLAAEEVSENAAWLVRALRERLSRAT